MAVDRIEELRRVAVLYARREGLDEVRRAVPRASRPHTGYIRYSVRCPYEYT